ncbi:hypothetical protein [Pseudoneobacillus sp. C159]
MEHFNIIKRDTKYVFTQKKGNFQEGQEVIVRCWGVIFLEDSNKEHHKVNNN